jgi:HAD superfamily hydrolase (TIGR01459 family)
MNSIPLIDSIAPLNGAADVWFLDIWGVLHNGIKPFAGAVSACQNFRALGGKVILVSNSPRPRSGVEKQLDHIGVPKDAYDAILTSGDVSRVLIAAFEGQPVFHLGPERDVPVFAGTGVELASATEAIAVVCTGLFDDETEIPHDYDARLQAFAKRRMPMICVNPDKTVERGGRIIYCAGALAEAYEKLGANVVYAGKPYAPIYEEAFLMAAQLTGRPVDKARVLAIGDGVATDIGGAMAAGVRAVYIASAVHVAKGENIADAAARLFPDQAKRPVAVMTALA